MSTALISREFNGDIIQQRELDGYVHATAMCKACGKLFADYNRLDTTQAFLVALSNDIDIHISQLVFSRKGKTSKFKQGTWVHPKVAEHLSRWLSDSIPSKETEKYIQQSLQYKLGGLSEVETSAGKIDLLTDSELIEIKLIKCWKHAIGQVIVLGTFYPNHTKRIHLFGKAEVELRIVICEVCAKLQIDVSFEEGYIG